MKRLLLVLALTTACGGPIPPPQPPAPPTPLYCLAPHVHEANGQPVAGAKAWVDNISKLTDENGYAYLVPIPAGVHTLHVEKDGYNPYAGDYEVTSLDCDLPITLTKLPPPHVDPATFSLGELAAVRGAMWSARLDLPYGPRPGQADNILPMVFYHVYSPEERKRMLAVYKAYGYTHAVSGPITGNDCYHGQYPCDQGMPSQAQWDTYLDELQEWWDAGIIPVVFLHPDGWTFEQVRDAFTPLLQQSKAQRVIRFIVPGGWEPVKYDWSSCTWALFAQWARQTLPNAVVFIHTVSDVDAPAGTDSRCNDDDHTWNPEGNGGAWRRVAPLIHGWLIQNGPYAQLPSESPQLAREFAAQFKRDGDGAVYHSIAWHFCGPGGWVCASAWGDGSPPRFIAAEQTAYTSYWRNLPEPVSQAWGDLAISAGADGYLDGGTVPVPVK